MDHYSYRPDNQTDIPKLGTVGGTTKSHPAAEEVVMIDSSTGSTFLRTRRLPPSLPPSPLPGIRSCCGSRHRRAC